MAALIHNHQLLVDKFVEYWSADATQEDIRRYYANLKIADVVIGEITAVEGGFVADLTVPSRGLTAPQQAWTPGSLVNILADKITATTLEELKESSVEGLYSVGEDYYIGLRAGYADPIVAAKEILGYDFDLGEIDVIEETDPETAGFVGTVIIESKMVTGEFKLIHIEGEFLIPPTDLGNLGELPPETP